MTELAEVAQLAGIWASFKDVWWNDYFVSEETTRHLLKALGFSADTDEEKEQAAQKLKAAKESAFQPVRLVPAQRQFRFAAPGAATWELKSEDGKTQSGTIARDTIMLPPLEMGYYELTTTAATGSTSCFLIVEPATCWQPESMKKGKRIWGVSAQLYGIRSKTNCGMGDLGDLTMLAGFVAEQKADLAGINPLHAMFPSDSANCSPYGPSNRLFLNTLYIDASAVEGFATADDIQKVWQSPELQEKLARARSAEFVDYPLVADIKASILKPLYAYFKTLDRHEVFDKFCAEGGERLHAQAVFDALSEYFYEKNGAPQNWHTWPEAYRSPASAEVTAFATGNADRVGFYKWLQWNADKQLAYAQSTALKRGMEIGLYRDLAVGAGSGAETWCNPEDFIRGVTIGAPPDEYNPNGQNWGLAAFDPFHLRATRYKSFIALLRANMRHCRALRIDHAFGLSRIFLIPEGKAAGGGTYVDCPFEELLAIVKLESHRNQCVVIGEDLGTFPPNYKEAAEKAGLLSYKIMYFEREADGAFKKPEHYEPQALATFSTHDLPTLEGWLAGEDIKEKEALQIYPSDELLQRDKQARERDKPLFDVALNNALGNTAAPLKEKAQLFLAKTPSAIVTVQLEDLLGIVRQANIPTTVSERPNWKMKLPVTLEDITVNDELKTIAAHVTEARRQPLIDYPRATYRLQFHKDFTFYNAASIVPYLAKLGVSHVYASPYLQARPGSTHGYDITDYNKLNPELGGEEGYEVFCKALEASGLKQLLDFVPNHMGVGGADNAWWLSVLEWGRKSPYASYFDITWESRYVNDDPKIILPFLGDHYGDVLDRGDLKLAFDAKEGSFSVWHFQHRFGICPRDYPSICDAIAPVATFEEGERRKAELTANTAMRETINACVEAINRDKERLHQLLELQHYRLAFWRVASSDINFRRFFDINDLAGIRVENKNLFEAIHRFAASLVEQGRVSGLRIDHVDGLADPAGYCRGLRQKLGSSAYIAVEKILAANETLPEDWPIQGTSGYDALNIIGNVFVNPRGELPLDRVYRRFTGIVQLWDEIAFNAKCLILETTLDSELQSLTLRLKRIAEQSQYTRDYPFDALKQALKDIIGCFPVYRTYTTPDYVSETDTRIISRAVNRARKLSQLVDTSVYDFIAMLLMLENDNRAAATVAFVRKFQQLTGPVMAKGVEDTSFYRFNRLLSLNEVGGAPTRFGLPLKNFHQTMKARSETLAHSMLATATHDTKRGEDMRMRLHILSERPMLWGKYLARWHQLNRSCRTMGDGVSIPSRNDEYFIYQTLLGSWPNELMASPPDKDLLQAYQKRLETYLIKALRESKLHSNWNNPDTVYEDGILKFLAQILDPARHTPFLGDMMAAAGCIAPLGMINSLGQTTLKLTLPGVPDIYQGCELWDYSLVDPDNRRPVDYKLREGYLADGAPLAEQFLHWQDGKVKQHLIHKLLQHRTAHSDLYNSGTYELLTATGDEAEHVLGFSRIYMEKKLIVVLPVLRAGKVKQDFKLPLPLYANTELMVSKGRYTNVLTGQAVELDGNILPLAKDFPIIVVAA